MFKKSFTLIEYLFVFAIIGVLTAALIPTLGSMLPNTRLNGSSKNLVFHLRQAQEEAVTSQYRHSLRFNLAAPANYKIIKLDPTESTVQEFNIPNDISVTLDPVFTDNQIIFSSDGGPNTAGNITLSTDGQTRVINISASGSIKLQL